MRDRIDRPGRDYRFGAFRFMPDRQTLWHRDKVVPLGARSLELLHLLVTRAGEVVSKQDLIDHIWPDAQRDESNLKVTVSALRRALRQGGGKREVIATVPHRGYRFIATVRVGEAEDERKLAPLRAQSGELPAIPALIGRREVIAALEGKLGECGLVTLVGPAGVGKTTIAVAAARELAARFPDGLRFADLASIEDLRLVGPAMALALGIDGGHGDPLAAMVDALGGKIMLLLLDNCEHVLSAAATIAQQIRDALPGLHILATSREPMRARSECLFRLPPLACPDADAALTATQALAYPAVELFAQRAEAQHGYRLSDEDAPVVAGICRHLDGIALAIELAVPQLTTAGPAALLALLKQGIEPLNRGMPQGLARHRTLLATLDWSYRLLSRGEARLFRLLAVFAAAFTIEDIAGVGTDSIEDLASWTAALVAKSLLTAVYQQGVAQYRLLESTRTFACDRLKAEGEADDAHARHASHLLAVLERAESEWNWRDRKDWTAAYAPHVPDLRKAIDWAFDHAPDGPHDPQLGIRLTVAAIPLWDELSSVGECQIRVERALGFWEQSGLDDPMLRMKLAASHGAALNFSDHLGPEADAAWEEAQRLAALLGDVDYLLRALWGQAVLQSFSGRHQQALETLRHFLALAEQGEDLSAIPDGQRLTLMTRFYIGEISQAEEGLTRLERDQTALTAQSRMARFQVDRLVGIRAALSMALWVQGDHRKAVALAGSSLARAVALGHRVSHSNVLAQTALPLALQLGDLAQARGHADALTHNLSLHETTIWLPVCRFYQAVIAGAGGDAACVDAMAGAVQTLIANNFLIRLPFYQAMLAEAALRFGRIDTAHHALGDAQTRAEQQNELWCYPEILRVRGLLEWRRGHATAAEASFAQSVEEAGRTGALTFQLRAATDLAAMLLESERRTEAVIRLTPIYAAFASGMESSDLRRAARILETLTSGQP